MLRFVGCDVHKRTAVFTILQEEGKLLARYTVPVTREALRAFAERQLAAEDHLAMEATTNTWAVAGVLRPFVGEIVIGNPLRVRRLRKPRSRRTK
jgi:transposase